MNPALAYTQNAAEVIAVLGFFHALAIFVVSAACSLGLVWVINRVFFK